jgi:hypothetical protein
MFELDPSEVPLLNFLSRPVFLLYPDLFIMFITEKEMLTRELDFIVWILGLYYNKFQLF